MKRIEVIIITSLLTVSLILGLIVYGKMNLETNVIPILTYHSVQDSRKGKDEWTISTEQFIEQVKYLKENEYKTIFVENINRYKNNKKTVILTFDDGYEDFYYNVLPIIKKYNIKVNLYIITDTIDQKGFLTSEQLKEIVDSKLVSIGSHTKTHSSLGELDDEQLNIEMLESKNILEDLLDIKIKTISYPYSDYSYEVIKATKKYYKYGLGGKTAVQSMKEFDRYLITRISVLGTDEIETFINVINNKMELNNIDDTEYTE